MTVRSSEEMAKLTSGERGARLERLEQDLRLAERVHRSLVPEDGRCANLDIGCDFTPADHIGGDYASVSFQRDGRVLVGICDVSGHGIAAALLANRVNSFVLQHAPLVGHPCELVEALNEFVYQHFYEAELYVTFFSIFIDLERQTILTAGCGHPPVLHCVGATGEVQRIESENQPIGLFEHLCVACGTVAAPFTPGDRLILYTDGLTESTDPTGRMVGVETLVTWCRDYADLTAPDFVRAIGRRADEYREGRRADDDQLLLAISHLGRNVPTVSDGTDPGNR